MKTIFDQLLVKIDNNDKPITSISWRSKQINNSNVKQLCDFIETKNTITNLDLKSNDISELGAEHISILLLSNKNIESLNLSYNRIGDKGSQQISEALQTNNSLKELNLEHNEIGDIGAKHISEALKINSTLKHIRLWNMEISDKGARYIIDALKSNYTITNVEGLIIADELLNKELQDALERNTQIEKCLYPLHNAMNNNDQINKKTITQTIEELSTLIPDFLYTMPDNSYPVEAHRILNALGHMNIFNKEEQITVLSGLLPSFKHQPFQKLANSTLGLLPVDHLTNMLTDMNLKREGLLLAIHSRKNRSDDPLSEKLAWSLLFDNKEGFDTAIKPLRENEFISLLQKSLNSCHKFEKLKNNKFNRKEINLLNTLLTSPVCSITLTTACQSPAFFDAFKNKYPNAQSFTTIDHCLLNADNKKIPLLVDLPQHKPQAVTQVAHDNYMNAQKNEFETPSSIVEKLKETISLNLSKKITLTSQYEDFTQNADEGRYHFFEVEGKDAKYGLPNNLQELKGDHLKSMIIQILKDQISAVSDQGFTDLKAHILAKNNPYTKVLRETQGVFSSLFNIETSSMHALNAMLDERETQISKENKFNSI